LKRGTNQQSKASGASSADSTRGSGTPKRRAPSKLSLDRSTNQATVTKKVLVTKAPRDDRLTARDEAGIEYRLYWDEDEWLKRFMP